MNNHKPDPSVLPCIGCRGAFPDCRHACADLDSHHAWQDRQRNKERMVIPKPFVGIDFGNCPAESVYVREVAG